MPELPEVETVRRGLAPFLSGARIEAAHTYRADLRFAFPEHFAQRLSGQTITHVGRRAKYLLVSLSGGDMWLSHLGMTGAFNVNTRPLAEPSRLSAGDRTGRHVHFTARLAHPEHGQVDLSYADPRRFGFMDLIGSGQPNRFLDHLGPEPLGNAVDATYLAARFSRSRTPIKSALLDQRIIAGLGNIYVCEALFLAKIAPWRPAQSLVDENGAPRPELEVLVIAIRKVLEAALEAGGSTLRDFANAAGQPGYFQHSFAVYGREGEHCLVSGCNGVVARMVQSGRSSFYCPVCQGG
ncbi:bifunctional DNA-formamidopyrimidine glycosylase/DNA-(apurinic or apyrimidinic site) lyase [Pelagibacterium lentulum]|uniref:Formamidopyrimidine-DNA glycosylase n=1 Tax=Pelagibacterium lentulum TaxID=2029865 RepID=A0A916R627_9HYPH|nr:bifunctional DNA-formamidopyrimidine glycosylase/DNA-(apurinic or apyrimidinic site) lyase [Pelagibacterium lentulum]GGA38057.1 formamidopyrimidine-DNA glycosylase [Pelagibacterium lentulum]